MLYRLNDTLYLELDRETMRIMTAAIRVVIPDVPSEEMRAKLGNLCATLECMIQRTPETDSNMDLIS